MPPLAAQLEVALREAKGAMSRPDPLRAQALLESVHARCSAAGLASEEIAGLLEMVQPSEILAITWKGATTKDGRGISREELRERLRTAAYSDDGWRKYLASLPRIEAPENHE
jgi:hypothetical protein